MSYSNGQEIRQKVALVFALVALACIILFVLHRKLNRPVSGNVPETSNSADVETEIDSPFNPVKKRGPQNAHGHLRDVDLRNLSPEQLQRVEFAQTAYRNALKEIEFRNSKLKWSKTLDDRIVRLYEVFPASKGDLKEANKAVDSILAGSDLKQVERKAFVKISSNAFRDFLEVNEHGSVVFFDIPDDVDKNIVVMHCDDRSGLDSLIKELDSSGGLVASFGDGVMRSVSRTDEGWRYEKFLMTEE